MVKVFLEEQLQYDGQKIYEKVKSILISANMKDKIKNKTILLKPSLVYPKPSCVENESINTHPIFIEGVCRAINDLGAKDIGVGENTSLSTPKAKLPSIIAFKFTDALEHVEKYARPIYFSEEEHVNVKIDNPLIQIEDFIVPKIWLDADLFISLPKIW